MFCKTNKIQIFLLKRISIVFVLIFLQTSFVYGWYQGEAKEETLQELKASIVELTKSNNKSNEEMINILNSNNQLTEQIVNLNESSKKSNEKMESLTNGIYWLTVVMVVVGFIQIINVLGNFAKETLNKLWNFTSKSFKKKQKQ
ncbi:MAG: hypothetical protein MRK02_02975 [Candidatus Scalindua sp.]|nr:hypothetical protein [Candidatus Scalindua sp.]